MKYLKRFNESIEDDIVEECKDILLPLIDDNIDIDITADNTRTYSPREVIRRILITIDVERPPFNLIKYTDDLEHLNSYLESEGYKYRPPSIYNNESFSDFISSTLTDISYEPYKTHIIFEKL